MNFELLKKENILHDYEQVRLRNKRRLQERQEEIYAKIPEIKQLQSENKLSYIALAKKKALGQAADTQEISNQNRSNSARIQELLLTHGYPATYLEPIYDCPVCKDLAYVDGKVCACFERRIVDALYRQSNMTQFWIPRTSIHLIWIITVTRFRRTGTGLSVHMTMPKMCCILSTVS